MNIDEILDQLIEDYKYYGSKNAGMIAKAKAQIDSYVEELIGEDEKICVIEDMGQGVPYEFMQGYSKGKFTGRNELRATLRQQVKGDKK